MGLDKIPNYISDYDKAERIYHNLESFEDPSELHIIKRALEITHYNDVPSYIGFQLDFTHALILCQLIEKGEKGINQAIQKLQDTGILEKNPSKQIIAHIKTRLLLAQNWIKDYAPPHLHINISKEIDPKVIKQISPENKERIRKLTKDFESINWTQEEIKQKMVNLREQYKFSRKEMATFFGYLYQIFLGTNRGPRFAPFIASLEKDWVINRLNQIEKH